MTYLKLICVPFIGIGILALIAALVGILAALCWIALVIFGIPGLVYTMVLAIAGIIYTIRTKVAKWNSYPWPTK